MIGYLILMLPLLLLRFLSTCNVFFEPGSIKVVANLSMHVADVGNYSSTPDSIEESSVIRRPDLCALEFGRGQIIGLWEILADKSTYEMTYTTSASCELLEISRQYFQV